MTTSNQTRYTYTWKYNTHVNIHVHTTHANTRTHTHTQIHTHTHTHTYMHMQTTHTHTLRIHKVNGSVLKLQVPALLPVLDSPSQELTVLGWCCLEGSNRQRGSMSCTSWIWETGYVLSVVQILAYTQLLLYNNYICVCECLYIKSLYNHMSVQAILM